VVFRAEGWAAVAKEDDALALLEARVAAAAIAEANLLKKVKGAKVAGEVAVEDLMFTSQEVVTRTEGYLARVNIEYAEPEESDGGPTIVTAIATLEIPRCRLRRLGDYVD
jgi:hypothetical protein